VDTRATSGEVGNARFEIAGGGAITFTHNRKIYFRLCIHNNNRARHLCRNRQGSRGVVMPGARETDHAGNLARKGLRSS
jgi:hypothetical protein